MSLSLFVILILSAVAFLYALTALRRVKRQGARQYGDGGYEGGYSSRDKSSDGDSDGGDGGGGDGGGGGD
ncbi:hypothetical protein [Sphingomonas sp. LHG3406-1]|uniref:hypothetical protein n=1 Tax=Sphingomonas sp. LHG3406-1 TaxID=2804617 RepID=UPI00262B69C4|nr:hypothetical protein [Sphingomonas sp. LHG3406-1]